MKKVKLLVTSLCLVTTLTLLVPTVALGIESGPQGGANSTPTAPPPPPPPPPPSSGGLLGTVIGVIVRLIT